MRLKITGIRYPSACTDEIPDIELKKQDHRPYFTHEERQIFDKPLKIISEVDKLLFIEGRLKIYRYDPKPVGEKEIGLIIFRGCRGDAEFCIVPDEKKESVSFIGWRKGFL